MALNFLLGLGKSAAGKAIANPSKFIKRAVIANAITRRNNNGLGLGDLFDDPRAELSTAQRVRGAVYRTLEDSTLGRIGSTGRAAMRWRRGETGAFKNEFKRVLRTVTFNIGQAFAAKANKDLLAFEDLIIEDLIGTKSSKAHLSEIERVQETVKVLVEKSHENFQIFKKQTNLISKAFEASENRFKNIEKFMGEKLSTKLDESIANQNEKIDSINSQLVRMDGRVSIVTRTLSKHDSEIKHLRGVYDYLNKKIDSVKSNSTKKNDNFSFPQNDNKFDSSMAKRLVSIIGGLGVGGAALSALPSNAIAKALGLALGATGAATGTGIALNKFQKNLGDFPDDKPIVAPPVDKKTQLQAGKGYWNHNYKEPEGSKQVPLNPTRPNGGTYTPSIKEAPQAQRGASWVTPLKQQTNTNKTKSNSTAPWSSLEKPPTQKEIDDAIKKGTTHFDFDPNQPGAKEAAQYIKSKGTKSIAYNVGSGSKEWGEATRDLSSERGKAYLANQVKNISSTGLYSGVHLDNLDGLNANQLKDIIDLIDKQSEGSLSIIPKNNPKAFADLLDKHPEYAKKMPYAWLENVTKGMNENDVKRLSSKLKTYGVEFQNAMDKSNSSSNVDVKKLGLAGAYVMGNEVPKNGSGGFDTRNARLVENNQSQQDEITSIDVTGRKAKIADHDQYKRYLIQQVKKSKLNGMVPKDADRYGIDGSPESWANYFYQLTDKESGYKNMTHGDRGHFGGHGSRGLFQLSPNDALNHKLQKEPFSYDQLHDPITNINAAIKITENLVGKTNSIRRGAGQYWGPVRRGWTPNGNRINKELLEQVNNGPSEKSPNPTNAPDAKMVQNVGKEKDGVKIYGDPREQFRLIRGAAIDKLKGTDPRLGDIMKKTAERFPLRVSLSSATYGRNKGYHSRGLATDIVIHDENGRPLPNYQSPETFRVYEAFANEARKVQQELYPELGNKFHWAGSFQGMQRGGASGKYGAADLMDFRLQDQSSMRAWKWGKGIQKGYEHYSQNDILGLNKEYTKEDLVGLKLTDDQNEYFRKKYRNFGAYNNTEDIGPRKYGYLQENQPTKPEVLTPEEQYEKETSRKAKLVGLKGNTAETKHFQEWKNKNIPDAIKAGTPSIPEIKPVLPDKTIVAKDLESPIPPVVNSPKPVIPENIPKIPLQEAKPVIPEVKKVDPVEIKPVEAKPIENTEKSDKQIKETTPEPRKETGSESRRKEVKENEELGGSDYEESGANSQRFSRSSDEDYGSTNPYQNPESAAPSPGDNGYGDYKRCLI